MSAVVGTVKQIMGGGVVAVDANGVERSLSVGDALYAGEVVKTSFSSNAVISLNSGKDVKISTNDTFTLDESVTSAKASGSDTVADVTALQKALLEGADLTNLEETAAGAGAEGGAGGTAQINPGYFTQGGHYSNISANYNNLDQVTDFVARAPFLSAAAATDETSSSAQSQVPAPTPVISNINMYSEDVWQSCDSVMDETVVTFSVENLLSNGTLTYSADGVTITPTSVTTNIKADGSVEYTVKFDPQAKGANITITATQPDNTSSSADEVLLKEYINIQTPTSAYDTQDLSGSIMQNYKDLVAHADYNRTESDGRVYDRFDASEFSYNNGWWVATDKSVIIGSDISSKTMLLINSTNDGLRAVTLADVTAIGGRVGNIDNVFEISKTDSSDLSVFGGDNVDIIHADGINFGNGQIYTGTSDNPTGVSNVQTTNDADRSYNGDQVFLKNGSEIKGVTTGSGNDEIRVTSRSNVTGDINTNSGNDFVNIHSGASITGDINLGDGDNQFKAHAGDGSGRHSTLIAEVEINGNITAGSGNDRIEVGADSQGGVTINGNITLGDGNDLIHNNGRANSATIKSPTIINGDIDMGNGNDAVWQDSRSEIRGNIGLGDGDDTYATWTGSKLIGNLDGGSGSNILDLRSNNFTLDYTKVSNIDTISLGEFNNKNNVTNLNLTANAVKDLLSDGSGILSNDFFEQHILKITGDANDKLGKSSSAWKESTNTDALDNAESGWKVYESKASDGTTVFIQVEDPAVIF